MWARSRAGPPVPGRGLQHFPSAFGRLRCVRWRDRLESGPTALGHAHPAGGRAAPEAPANRSAPRRMTGARMGDSLADRTIGSRSGSVRENGAAGVTRAAAWYRRAMPIADTSVALPADLAELRRGQI